jgi:hypothetical protein
MNKQERQYREALTLLKTFYCTLESIGEESEEFLKKL